MAAHPEWYRDAERNGWVMPVSPWWKRLPIIRHVRAVYGSIMVSRHNSFWLSAGLIPTGYDQWVLHGIWHGEDRPHDR